MGINFKRFKNSFISRTHNNLSCKEMQLNYKYCHLESKAQNLTSNPSTNLKIVTYYIVHMCELSIFTS